MEPVQLHALVLQLLIAAQGLSGYAAPDKPPEIVFLQPEELERRACGKPCAVFGWFPPGLVIYLDERLNPLEDLRARAVLLHELVHFLQQENGAFEGPATCRTWLAREDEAFRIEQRWLAQQPEARRLARQRPRVPLRAFCRDEPESMVGPSRRGAH